MMNLLKNKRFMIYAAPILLVIVAITVILIIPKSKTSLNENTQTSPDQSTSSPTITINVPGGSTSSAKTPKPFDNTTDKIEKSPLVVDVSKETQNTDIKKTPSPVKSAAKPIKTVKPTQPTGIIIGGDAPTETKYDCKTPKHHCINAENHAYIENLEIQGCIYCRSHSCPSFYAVSLAGIPICDPKLCPQYDIKKDPIEYCQKCGRKNGNGDNNTCQKYIVDFTCPKCGVVVQANQCHTH